MSTTETDRAGRGEAFANAPHLAQSPRKAVIETVGDTRVLTDGTRRLVIHRIEDFSHVDTMLMAYLPSD